MLTKGLLTSIKNNVAAHRQEDYYDLCTLHRGHKKKCLSCGELHYRQGLTCSKECAYELKKISWLKSCGTTHNFSKQSSSRIEWENEILLNEGIVNVFQRESVKEKIKKTISSKYGRDDEEFNNISQTKLWKDLHASNYILKYGMDCYIEKEIHKNTNRSIYYKNVWSITWSQLKLHAKDKFGMSIIEIKDYNKTLEEYKEKLSIDHKFSCAYGFIQNVSPLIIGSIHNLELLPAGQNSSKGSKCSMDLITLKKLYEND